MGWDVSAYTVHWPESAQNAHGCLPSQAERPCNHAWFEAGPFATYAEAEVFALAKVHALGESGQTWASLVVRIAQGGVVVADARSVLWCADGVWCRRCGGYHRCRLVEGYAPHFARLA